MARTTYEQIVELVPRLLGTRLNIYTLAKLRDCEADDATFERLATAAESAKGVKAGR